MKRTDITDIFPEATKEQIDKLMGINGSDINAAKGDLEALRQQLTDQSSEELAKAQQQVQLLTNELDTLKAAEAIRLTREKVANEKKIPANLLTGETEEACAQQADAILAFAQPASYPAVKDGGEPHGTPKTSTRDKFADWAKEVLN